LTTYSSDDIPVSNYYKCNESLKNLYKYRFAYIFPILSNRLIQEFEEIEQKFSDELNDFKAKYYRMKMYSIIKKRLRLKIMNDCLMNLHSISNHEATIKQLKEIGYKYRTVKQLSGSIKMLDLKIKSELKEIEASKEGEGVSVMQLSCAIEKYKGFEIKPNKYPMVKLLIDMKNIKDENGRRKG